MPAVFCLECTRLIKLATLPVEGQVIPCPHCGIHLEVLEVDPLELDWVSAPTSEGHEDWEWWQANKHLIEAGDFDH
jgi:lysine biosynthesis protein LysW